MNVGVHQGSVLSPLLFIIVMEAVTHTPLGQNICILFYFQAFCKFLGL